jgi:ribosomal protein S18 acetylase RimI-like enzyme
MVNKWSQDLVTRTGFRFNVRPVRPTDEDTLAEFFTHVTADDLRFRFLTGINEVSHDRIVALATVDHQQKENFLAFDELTSTMIATGMLACDPQFDRGEVAISIRKDYKDRGVAWELLSHIARFAEAKGVKVLESIESHENHAAIELEREMGFTAEPYQGDATLVLVSRKLKQTKDA